MLHRRGGAAALLAAALLAAAVGGGWAAKPAQSPAPRDDDRWRACFDKEVAEMRKADSRRQTAPRIVFLGDSITESWRGTDHCLPCNPRGRTGCDGHAAIFESAWGHYGAAAMGIGGDQVAHLMWRMKNGALPRRNQPGVVVILIGTNDLGAVARGTPPGVESALAAAAPGVARRVQQAVQLAKERLPAAEVVLLGVLPRGTGSGEGKLPAGREAYRWPSVYAQAIGSVNAQLRGWAQGQSRVHFIDCGSAFLAANGRSISPSLMPDALHPGAAGMAALAACAGPLIGGLL